MFYFLRRQINSLTITPNNRVGIRIIQIAIGFFILFRSCTEIPYANYFWGPNGFGRSTTVSSFGSLFDRFIDSLLRQNFGNWVFIGMLTIGSIGLLLGYQLRFAMIFACLGFWVLELRNPYLGDGGDNITRIVLIYLLFIIHGFKDCKPGFRVWLHNLAVWAIKLQVLILYVVAGYSKFGGEVWINRTDLYYISQTQWFSTPFYANLSKNMWLTTFVTYGTMIFQASSPFLSLVDTK